MVARKKTASKKVAAKKAPAKSSTAIVSWQDQMAADAVIASALEANTGGGQFFSTANGVLSWQDNPMANNEMAVIVLDAMFENVFYEGRYNPAVITPPTCFAFARDEDELAPHESVVALGQGQNKQCEGCEHNEWGTADTGVGKACRNTRRLALLSAGTFDKNGDFEMFEPSGIAGGDIGFLKLPVTSVKGYAAYVKQIAATLKRPLYGMITRVAVVPDNKSQFKVVFEALEQAPDDLMQAIIDKRAEAAVGIDFPYNLEHKEPAKPAKPAARGKKKAARGRY